MTTTAEATSRFTLGQALEYRSDFAELPIGSIVQYRTSTHYRKDAPNVWTVGDRDISGPYNGATYDDTHFILGQNYLRHIGSTSEPYSGPGIGVPLTTTEMFEAVPVGAVIRSRNGHRYTRTDRGYTTASGVFRACDFFARDGRLSVETLPPGVAGGRPAAADVDHNIEIDLALLRGETLTRYLHRFRTTTRGAAQRAGVNIDPLETALRRLNVPDLEHVPGVVIDGYDYEAHTGWPDGTVVVCGHPTVEPTFAVHGYDNRGWTRLLGEASFSGNQHRVVSVPGVETPAWVSEEWTEEQAALILAFQKEAWKIGVKAKRENSWCSDYEAAMMRMGIDESIETSEVGTFLSAEEVAALEPGTFLRVIASPGNAVLLVRDDSSPNPAKTLRMAGSIPGSWAANGMTVAGVRGAADMRVAIASHAEMDEMPVNTIISDRNRNQYRKYKANTPTDNRSWRQVNGASYSYAARDFGLGQFDYVVIP